MLHQSIFETNSTYDHVLGRLQRIKWDESGKKLTAVLSTNSKVATTVLG